VPDQDGRPRARRLLAAFYDSVVQRDYVEAAAGATDVDWVSTAILSSRLRLDLILSGTVVLTDAQLLDGALFARSTPLELEALLRITPWSTNSVVVRTRAPSLESSLLGLVTAKEGRVKSFEFSILDEPHRSEVTDYLREQAANGSDAPTSLDSLMSLLGTAGVPRADVDRVSSHWARWIEHLDATQVHDPVVGVENFTLGDLDFDRAIQLHDRDEPMWEAEVEGASKSAGRAVEQVRQSILRARDRSLIYADIRAAVSDPYGQQLLFDYVDRVFGFAFALQHECEDHASTWRLPVQRVAGGRRGQPMNASDMEELARFGLCEYWMPSDFMARLALVDPGYLTVWALEMIDPLRRWRDETGGGSVLRPALTELEDLLATAVTPSSVAYSLLGTVPKPRLRSAWDRLAYWIKRYAAGTGTDAALQLVDAAGGQRLSQFVSLMATPAREVARQVLGNPAVLSTDIAWPRRIWNEPTR
jgi:hypothetical protein